MRKAVKLKKEAFWAWLFQGSAEVADRYQVAKRAAVLVVADTKTRVWETIEKDFHLASRMFWQAFPGWA